MRVYLSILCLFVALLAAQEPYTKVVHSTDPKARCLDGSPPAIYIHQGSQPMKFLIYFNGGGLCNGTSISEVLQSCYQRSKTPLGSTLSYPNKLAFDGGMLSTNPENSAFASWTKVFILYCDGSYHQGSNQGSIFYKDAQLFFRGGYNTRSHFKYLIDEYGLYNAQKVVLAGDSAGGVAAQLWNNYLKSLLRNPNEMVLVSDSAVFMNVKAPSGQFRLDTLAKQLYGLANIDELTPNDLCNKQNKGLQYKCFFMETAYSTLSGRVLLINSQYDSELIPRALGIKCIKAGNTGSTLSDCNQTQLLLIERYRADYLIFASSFQLSSLASIWTISCSNHVYTISAGRNQYYDVYAQKVPENKGLTVRNAVENFVLKNEKISAIDDPRWPNNTLCAY